MKRRFMRTLILCLAVLLFLSATAEAQQASSTPSIDQFQYVYLGRYPQTEKGEALPILWKVLSVGSGKAQLLSVQVLDVQPVHTAEGYDGFEQSNLKVWLQEDFAKVAFSPEELEILSSGQQTAGVTLPSTADLRNESYGFLGNTSRYASGTYYALSKGLQTYGVEQASYWTSSRGESNTRSQLRVMKGGSIGYSSVKSADIGVRPMIELELDAVSILSGEGTAENPLILAKKDTISYLTELPSPESTASPSPKPIDIWGKTGSLLTEGFPSLTTEGFLPEGAPEYVFIDDLAGVWRYASQTLRVVITREQQTKPKVRVLVAEIFVKEGSKAFRMVSNQAKFVTDNRAAYNAKPAVIAKNNNLVFALSSDYYIYRIRRAQQFKGNAYPVGVIIREGDILVDLPPAPKRVAYPPLDMLALFEDGDMQVYAANELTAQELLEQGVRDVLAFGPYLIRDGEMNTFHDILGNTNQPRAGIGIFARGHYAAIIVEGRIRESVGIPVRELARMFQEMGCRSAFNLDGGWTSAMIFMGKQLNQMDNSGVKDNARVQTEVLGIGNTQTNLTH